MGPVTERDFINKIPMPHRIHFTRPKHPIASIVCWRCKGNRRPLHNVKDANGKKTQDYVCDIDMMLGFYRPSIGNQSQVFFQYE